MSEKIINNIKISEERFINSLTNLSTYDLYNFSYKIASFQNIFTRLYSILPIYGNENTEVDKLANKVYNDWMLSNTSDFDKLNDIIIDNLK